MVKFINTGVYTQNTLPFGTTHKKIRSIGQRTNGDGMGYFDRTENFREYIKTAHFSRVEAYNSTPRYLPIQQKYSSHNTLNIKDLQKTAKFGAGFNDLCSLLGMSW